MSLWVESVLSSRRRRRLCSECANLKEYMTSPTSRDRKKATQVTNTMATM
jgi:hypothetical protein